MLNPIPTETELSIAIQDAMRTAVLELFATHPEHFYYITLITTGQAHPPVLSAWSLESLKGAVADCEDEADAIWGLKWSYAESPYYCFGEEYFKHVVSLFRLRPDIVALPEPARREEYEKRIRAMEHAVAQLDIEGLFGRDEKRLEIVVNVEVMPPDHSNTERAMRLNPMGAIRTWLQEAAE